MASFPFVIKRMSLRASAAVSVRQDIRVMLDFVSPLSATPREGFPPNSGSKPSAARPRAGDPITKTATLPFGSPRSTGVLVTASTIQILAGDPEGDHNHNPSSDRNQQQSSTESPVSGIDQGAGIGEGETASGNPGSTER